ncbi:MAG TPA: hypothetical protein VJB59_12110 [Bdellovibrionota bacterium]|nr:hypothetical protein [Bdellovibrionota bacterium]
MVFADFEHMGAYKPTRSSRERSSIPSRRPVERWAASDSRSHAEIMKGAEIDHEAGLRPQKGQGPGEHSHSAMRGPGLSIPGRSMRRRAGSRRKYREK